MSRLPVTAGTRRAVATLAVAVGALLAALALPTAVAASARVAPAQEEETTTTPSTTTTTRATTTTAPPAAPSTAPTTTIVVEEGERVTTQDTPDLENLLKVWGASIAMVVLIMAGSWWTNRP